MRLQSHGRDRSVNLYLCADFVIMILSSRTQIQICPLPSWESKKNEGQEEPRIPASKDVTWPVPEALALFGLPGVASGLLSIIHSPLPPSLFITQRWLAYGSWAVPFSLMVHVAFFIFLLCFGLPFLLYLAVGRWWSTEPWALPSVLNLIAVCGFAQGWIHGLFFFFFLSPPLTSLITPGTYLIAYCTSVQEHLSPNPLNLSVFKTGLIVFLWKCWLLN